MNCKSFLYLLIFFIVNACDVSNNKNSKNDFFKLQNKYKNSGFALIYSNDLSNVKKLESRSLNIYHKSLKKRSKIKITNPSNGKYLIAEVKSNKTIVNSPFKNVQKL